MVPQPQIHFAKHNLKNLRGHMSIPNITARENQARFDRSAKGSIRHRRGLDEIDSHLYSSVSDA
jgi:hypothetical protein